MRSWISRIATGRSIAAGSSAARSATSRRNSRPRSDVGTAGPGNVKLPEWARHVRLARMALSSRTAAAALALTALSASPLASQVRRTLDRNDPQAQLMGYYATVLQFSPVGLADKDGRLEIGVAGSPVPSPSLSARAGGFGGNQPQGAHQGPVLSRLGASAGGRARRGRAGG